ncbi:hypothetical protein EMCRGX_G026039 [Ephydatia muelleri]
MTTAFIVKFFQKGDDVELYFEGDLLLDARQFKIAVPDSTIYFLPVNTRILFGRTEQCISLITSVEQKPTDIVQWEAATDSFKRFSSEVFQIAYCSFFELSKAEAWHQICVDFVHSVRDFMPKMLRKQKVHYILHLVQCMQDYGPSSSFCAERPESFNSNIRMQNIFGNKQAPSRDIAVHFAVIEHLRFVCEGGYYNDKESCDTGLHDLYYSNQVQRFLNSAPSKELNAHKAIYTAATARMPSGACDQFMFLKVTITELGVESTLEQILKMDPPYDVIVHLGSLMDGKLQQFKAVMSHTVELVHAGNYIELDPPFCEFKYGQLLTTIKSEAGHTYCLVQGFEAVEQPDGQPLVNSFDCPLYYLSRKLFTVDSSAIVRAVSMVHECGSSCKLQDAELFQNVEREEMATMQCVLKHDWTLPLFCYNVYCIL